jgi:hypothetical protein
VADQFSHLYNTTLRYIAIHSYNWHIIVPSTDCKTLSVERVKVTLTSKDHCDSFVLIKQPLFCDTHYALCLP